MIGKRIGYGKEALPPHSLTMSMIGASLLWVGWFGFNAGSNLEANGTTALAFVNTMVATAAAALSWLLVEWAVKGKPSLLGMISGAVAGLVAVTPASGYAGPMGSLVLGLIVSPLCLFFVSTVKSKFGYDDALDVFGVHCIGGITGAIGTGILVAPALGGVGITDYTNFAHNNARHLRHGGPAHHPGQGRRHDPRVVGRRLGDPVLDRRQGRRTASGPEKPSAKASTSPITANAPTTTDRRVDLKNEAAGKPAAFFVSTNGGYGTESRAVSEC